MADLEIEIGAKETVSEKIGDIEKGVKRLTGTVRTETEKIADAWKRTGEAMEKALSARSSPAERWAAAAGGSNRTGGTSEPNTAGSARGSWAWWREGAGESGDSQSGLSTEPEAERLAASTLAFLESEKELISTQRAFVEESTEGLTAANDELIQVAAAMEGPELTTLLDGVRPPEEKRHEAGLIEEPFSLRGGVIAELEKPHEVLGVNLNEFEEEEKKRIGDELIKGAEELYEPRFKNMAKIGSDILVPSFEVIWNDIFDTGDSLADKFMEKLAAKFASQAFKGLLGGVFGALMPQTSILKGVASVFGLQHGGFVGGTGGPDSQLRLLSPREYVVNERAAVSYAPLLESINRGERVGGGTTINQTINMPIQAIDTRDFKQRTKEVIPEIQREFARLRIS